MEFFTFNESLNITDLIVRVTLLLGSGIVISHVLRKSSAYSRHMTWTLVFAVLLILPIGMAFLPAWNVAVLPASPEMNEFYSTSPASLPSTNTDESARYLPEVSAPLKSLDIQKDAERAVVEDSFSVAYSPAQIFIGIWLLGSLAALISLLIGKVRLIWLVRSSEPVLDPDWLDEMKVLKRRLGIRRDVCLLMHNAISTPLTCGSVQPAILVPDKALNWSVERIRVVLAHELIHVQRYDALRHMISKINHAIYWFHPLSWLASRMAAISREQACDEAVLVLGTRPSTYANELLDLADSMRAEPSYAVLPMVRKSQLEKRLMAILDPNRPKKNLVANVLVLAGVSLLGLATVIAHPVRIDSDTAEAAERMTATMPTLSLEPSQASRNSVDERFPRSIDRSLSITEPLPEWPEEPVTEARPDQENRLRELTEAFPVPVSEEGRNSRSSNRFPLPLRRLPVDKSCSIEDADNKIYNYSGYFRTVEVKGKTIHTYSGSHNSDRVVQSFQEGVRLCMRVHGDIEVNEDIFTVGMPAEGAWFVVEAEDTRLYRMVVTAGDRVTMVWTVDGVEKEVDAKAREWMRQAVGILDNFVQVVEMRGLMGKYEGEIAAIHTYEANLRGELISSEAALKGVQIEIEALEKKAIVSSEEAEELKEAQRNLEAEIAALHEEVKHRRANSEGNEERVREVQERLEKSKAIMEEYESKRKNELDKFRLDAERLEKELKDKELGKRMNALQKELEEFNMAGRVAEIQKKMEELHANKSSRELENGIDRQIRNLKRMHRMF